MDGLQASLNDIRAHPDWEAAGFGADVPDLEIGYPGGYALPEGALRKNTSIGPGHTETPSPYRTAVFVLSPGEVAAGIGTRGTVQGTFELMCPYERQCAEVTSAFFVDPGFIDDEGFEAAFTRSIGLEPLNETHGRSESPEGVPEKIASTRGRGPLLPRVEAGNRVD